MEATMNDVTYSQVLSWTMRLSDSDKYALYRELYRGLKTSPLREIRKRNMPMAHTITMDEIVAECKTVRQELYNERNGK